MGNSAPPQITYAVPVTQFDPYAKQTATYRNPRGLKELATHPEGATTMQEVYKRSAQLYSNKEFLKWRLPNNGDQLGPWTSQTYGQCHEISTHLGQGLIALHLVEKLREYLNYEMQFVAVYAKNRREWVLLDQACALFGITIVPIYDTLGAEAVRFIYQQTNVTTLFCTANYIDEIFKERAAGRTSRLENLVIMDMEPTQKHREGAAQANMRIYSFDEVVSKGKQSGVITLPVVKPTDIYSFSYTSGTTGNPKAAMISHGNMLALIVGIMAHEGTNFTTNEVALSYLPLAHIMEHEVMATMVYLGATYAFYNGDVLKLREDMADIKPTMFVSVPRLFNRFYDLIRQNFGRLEGCKKWLADKAVETKLQNFNDSGDNKHCLYDRLVFSKIQEIFGGRITKLVTGSAPLSADVMKFFKIAMGVPFFEGYGQTESTGALFLTHYQDPRSGHVGGPLINAEFKLVDVDDNDYHSTDKDANGNPQPRGEIYLRGPLIIPGYYKDEEKTKETINSEGWLKTGDVGVLHPDGSLKIIDRAKNIFKLQQGEYVAPEKIENILVLSPWILECYVYGDSLQNHIVAVLICKPDGIKQLGEANGFPGTVDELARNEKFQAVLLKEIEKFSKKNGLVGFEIVRQIHVEPRTSFGELGLMTPSFKLKRNDVRKYYKQVFDNLYKIPMVIERGGTQTSVKTEGAKNQA